MRPGAVPLAALVVGSLLARPAGAQITAAVDAGGGNARIDQAGNGSIALVAPAVAWRHPLMSLDARGVYSGMGERGWMRPAPPPRGSVRPGSARFGASCPDGIAGARMPSGRAPAWPRRSWA